MKKRIISMAMSVVVAISALPLFSSCSGGIGGTNINQELVKDFELNQSDIEILVKPFEVANQARNELNSKNEITNDDLEDFKYTMHLVQPVLIVPKAIRRIILTGKIR